MMADETTRLRIDITKLAGAYKDTDKVVRKLLEAFGKQIKLNKDSTVAITKQLVLEKDLVNIILTVVSLVV